MYSIEILEREHEWIGWMTEVLEAFLAEAKAKDKLPPEAYQLLALYETFADGRPSGQGGAGAVRPPARGGRRARTAPSCSSCCSTTGPSARTWS